MSLVSILYSNIDNPIFDMITIECQPSNWCHKALVILSELSKCNIIESVYVSMIHMSKCLTICISCFVSLSKDHKTRRLSKRKFKHICKISYIFSNFIKTSVFYGLCALVSNGMRLI